MRKRKSYSWFFVGIILFVFYISFFYMERTEISDLDLLLVVGVDKTEDGYQVTGLYNKNGGVDEAIGGTKMIDGSGNSFYDAYQNLVQKNLKSVSIAHTTYFLFSEGVARDGIAECLDFVERDQTVKMNALIYLLRGTTANTFIQKTIDEKTHFQEDLKAISNKQVDERKVVDNNILKISENLKQGYGTVLIPYLLSEGEYLYIDGYGVFKEDHLVAYLEHEQAITLDLVRNRLRTYPIFLEDGVGIQITDSETSNEIAIVNGNLNVNFDVVFESDIKEVTTNDHIYEKYYIRQLENMQNQYVGNKIDELIQFSEDYNVDIFGVAKQIRTSYVNDWETISSNWNHYFSNISYQYTIKSQTAQSYVVAS